MLYSANDVWFDDIEMLCGITDYAVEQLGEITYVDFTVKEGDRVNAGDVVAFIESAKVCAEVISPIAGIITNINDCGRLPEELNTDGGNVTWMFELESDCNAKDLMTEDEYKEYRKC